MSHITTTERSLDLGARSAAKRTAAAHVRRQLADGSLTLEQVFNDPPEVLKDKPLFEVLLMARQIGPARLHEINGRAVRHHVNLAVPLGRASRRTLHWTVALVRGEDQPALRLVAA